MEQDVNVGTLGQVKIDEDIAGESISGTIGPVTVSIQISNSQLVSLVASRLPTGVMHDAVVALQAALFPAPAAPAPAAPAASTTPAAA